YMLTAVMLSILGGSASGWHIAWDIFAQLFFGTALGLGIGRLAALGFRNIRFQTQGFDSLYIFAVAIAAYAIPSILGGNGYLSAYLVGIILGNEEFKNKKTLVSFFDGLTGLMQVLIFFLLGLLARPAMMHKAILPALAVFVFLLLVARPAAVFSILTPFKKYPFRQQALISFVGLRGAASIVFAIMAIVTATDLNKDIFNIVFVLVLMSIALQGSLIPWVAKKLDMLDKGSDVMKTFNDYSEEEDVTFSRINLREDSSWTGKTIGELSLPRTMLVVLVLRDGERIQPKGDTLLKAGDSVITLTHAFNGSEASLYEKTVKVGSRRVGRPMSEHPGAGLVVMIRRGDKSLIPSGDTILQAGDRLVILTLSGEKKI
ncbi:MAG: cation:proton antiporter, partial [Bacteroidales bacterium]|nr:cation:proton antiporter [Bacteroidales bacterium]